MIILTVIWSVEFKRSSFQYLYMFSVLSTTPCVRLRLRPLMPVSLDGGDHQFTTDPTTGTCRKIPSDQSFSSDSRCKSEVAVSMPCTTQNQEIALNMFIDRIHTTPTFFTISDIVSRTREFSCTLRPTLMTKSSNSSTSVSSVTIPNRTQIKPSAPSPKENALSVARTELDNDFLFLQN